MVVKGIGVGMANAPKPAELRILQGNPGKRPIRTNDGIAPLEYGYVEPLRELGVAGKQFWDSVFGVGELWISIKTDTQLVQLLCEQIDRREWLRAYIVEHPDEWHMVKQLNDTEVMIVKNLSLLGFTPADRTRLGLVSAKTKSKLEELLAKKAQKQNDG
jgi:hypothetical protein